LLLSCTLLVNLQAHGMRRRKTNVRRNTRKNIKRNVRRLVVAHRLRNLQRIAVRRNVRRAPARRNNVRRRTNNRANNVRRTPARQSNRRRVAIRRNNPNNRRRNNNRTNNVRRAPARRNNPRRTTVRPNNNRNRRPANNQRISNPGRTPARPNNVIRTPAAPNHRPGMNGQLNALIREVMNHATHNNINTVRNRAENCARAMGLNLNFNYTGNGSQYTLRGRFNNRVVCTINVTRRGNSWTVNGNMRPSDGCIKNAQTGNLCIGRGLETVFVKNGNTIREGNNANFNTNSRNVYKVRAEAGLHQPHSGPCGFYSIFHLSQLKSGASLLDRHTFERIFDHNVRHCDTSASNHMRQFIQQRIRNLNAPNVMISSVRINQANGYVSSFGRNNLQGHIRDFQRNGTSQYIIASTDENSGIRGLRLNWDNRNDRLSCLANHWIALKISWSDRNRSGRCPIEISVVDSGGVKDNRYTALVHWYYNLFTHAYNYYR